MSVFSRFSKFSFSRQVALLSGLSLLLSIVFGYWFGKLFVFLFSFDESGGIFLFSVFFAVFFVGFLSAFLFFFPFFVFFLLPKKQKSVIIKGVVIPFLLFLLNGFQYSLFALALISGGVIIGFFLRYFFYDTQCRTPLRHRVSYTPTTLGV